MRRSSGEIFAAATTVSFKAFNRPSRFSFGRPEMNVISSINQVIRMVESEERPRVTKLRRRQDMDDLKEIVRRYPQRVDQALLDRVRDPAEPSLIVAPFEDVDLSDGHGVVSSLFPTLVRPRHPRTTRFP